MDDRFGMSGKQVLLCDWNFDAINLDVIASTLAGESIRFDLILNDLCIIYG